MPSKKSVGRTLSLRDREILYEKAGHKCEACGREISFTEMQAGHKKAASKGGRATLKNSVCLCYRCNKLQGTDSFSVFLKKLGKNHRKEITKTPRKSKHYICKAGKYKPLICPGYKKASSKCLKVGLLGEACPHLKVQQLDALIIKGSKLR